MIIYRLFLHSKHIAEVKMGCFLFFSQFMWPKTWDKLHDEVLGQGQSAIYEMLTEKYLFVCFDNSKLEVSIQPSLVWARFKKKPIKKKI